MGTRADFYIGRGPQARWLGSLAWDGYPDGIDAAAANRHATTEAGFLEALVPLKAREDWSQPERDGWPWPWDDSGTTDYAYALDGGTVFVSRFGSAWVALDAALLQPENDFPKHPKAVFPNMAALKRVTYGKRSGVIIIGGPPLP